MGWLLTISAFYTASVFLLPQVSPQVAQRRNDRALRMGPIQCTSEGFFADPYDCAVFYRCARVYGNSFTTYEFRCPEGSTFDTNINECTYEENTSRLECTNRPQDPLIEDNPEGASNDNINDDYGNPARDYGVVQPQAGSNPPPQNPSYGSPSPSDNNEDLDNSISDPSNPSGSTECATEGFFPVPGDCKRFYRCVNGGTSYMKYEFFCGPGTVWDPDISACNHPWATRRKDCKSEQSSSETPEPEPQPGSVSSTPANPTSSTTSQVVNSTPQVTSPAPSPGTAYQQSTTEGISTPELINATSGEVSSTTEINQASGQNEPQCTSEGFYPVPGNCRKFIRCVDTGNNKYTKYEFECGDGTVWDVDEVTCNYPYAVKRLECNTNTSPQPPSSDTTVSSSTTSQFANTTNSQSTSSTSSFTNSSTTSSQQTATTSSSSSQTTSQQSGSTTSSSGSTSSTSSSSSTSMTSSTSSQQTSSTSNQSSTSSGSSQQTTSSGQQTTSSGQQTTSSGQQSTSTGQQTTSSGQQTTSTGQQTTSSGQQTTSTGQQTTSTGQQTTSTGQQTTSTGQQTTSSGQQTTSSGQQTTSSGQQTTSTGQQTTSSANQTTTSGTSTTVNPQAQGSGKPDTCTSEGFFPSSSDCNKFYRCVNNGAGGYTKYDFNCGPGTVWDPDNNVCNHPWAVSRDCGSSTATSPTTNTTNVSTSPTPDVTNTTKPLSSTTTAIGSSTTSTPTISPTTNTSTYSTTSSIPSTSSSSLTPTTTVDSNANLTETTTSSQTTSEVTTQESSSSTSSAQTSTTTSPDSTESSTIPGTTLPPGETTTLPNENQTDSTPCTTTPNPSSNIKCEKAGFYPHPNDCTKFYRCVDWDGDKGDRFSIYYFDCPSGTIFDPSLNICNHAESVYPPRNCNGSTEQTTTSSNESTTIDATTNPTTDQETTTITNSTAILETTTIDQETTPTSNSTATPETTTTTEQETTPVTNSTTEQETTPVTNSTTLETTTNTDQETTPSYNTTTTQISTTNLETTTDAITTSESSTPQVTTGQESTTVVPTTSVTEPTVTDAATQTTIPDESTTQSTTPSGSTTTESEATTTPQPADKCPETNPDQVLLVCPTGFRRHPTHCNLFYQCTMSPTNEIKVLTLSCPNGTVYDSKKIQCLSAEEAEKCDGTMADLRTPKKVEGSPEPIPVKSSEPICPGRGSFPYKQDCRMFYKCTQNGASTNLSAYLYQCPDGYTFWNRSKRCEKQEKVPCDSKGNFINRSVAPIEEKNIGTRR